MAEAMTYDSLADDIQVYVERDDAPFISQIPRFIMLAENRLSTEVRGLGAQKYVTGTLSAGTLAKPERWRETISFNLTISGQPRKFLLNRSYDYCRAYADPTTTGVPRFYSDYQFEHFLVVPAPAVSYAFELAYYQRPEPLSTERQVNWYTQYVPQLLLYACLLEAQPFLKRPERIAEFQALYDRALQGLATESTRRIQADRASSKRNGE